MKVIINEDEAEQLPKEGIITLGPSLICAVKNVEEL